MKGVRHCNIKKGLCIKVQDDRGNRVNLPETTARASIGRLKQRRLEHLAPEEYEATC